MHILVELILNRHISRLISRKYYIFASCALLLAVLIMGPLWAPGYWLYGDAVSTPRSFLTPDSLGIGDLAPRAIPQDWLIAQLSKYIDGGLIVKVITWLGLAAIGYATCILVTVIVRVSTFSAVVTMVFIMLNPFILERLHQGQWSFISGVGYALLMLALFVVWIVSDNNFKWPQYWWAICMLIGLSALTISSALIADFFLIMIVIVRWWCYRCFPLCLALFSIIGVFCTNMPWLLAGVIHLSVVSVDPSSVLIYRIRGDSILGSFGAIISLAGIWNRFAVTAIRTNPWTSLLQTVIIAGVVIGGLCIMRKLFHVQANMQIVEQNHRSSPPYSAICAWIIVVFAVVMLVLVGFSATPWGSVVLSMLIHTVPGIGVLRDSQKFLGIALPAYALASAAFFQWCIQIKKQFSWMLLSAVAIVQCDGIISSWGTTMHAIHYPRDFADTQRIIAADPGGVVSLPAGIMRKYSFLGGAVGIDPLPRILPVQVRSSGMVYVDGVPIDSAQSMGTIIENSVLSASAITEVQKLPIKWIVSANSPGYWGNFPNLSKQLTLVYRGDTLSVYRVPNASDAARNFYNSHGQIGWRIMQWAHSLWFVVIISGFICGIICAIRYILRQYRY